MAASSEASGKFENVLYFFKRIQHGLDKLRERNIELYPRVKQHVVFDYLLNGKDVMAVLPTGFGKSLLFQLLPDIIPIKANKNIVIVISPLNSIIEDQLNVLHKIGISGTQLQLEKEEDIPKLFDHDNIAHQQQKKLPVPTKISKGEYNILFSHPESLLSEEGRILLSSEVYQKNVVAFVIDEVHCVEKWGKQFRKDFMDLSSLKVLIQVPVLAMTATASPSVIKQIQQALCINTFQIVKVSPNRSNLKLSKLKRMGNNKGFEGYDAILKPIAESLNSLRESFPMTIIYMRLAYCGYAYRRFCTLIKNHFVGGEKQVTKRLFTQFHASSTKFMKEAILEEIKNNSSCIRVIFATTALGMGVDAPFIRKVIHIRPPTEIEEYVQEIGRAGRDGSQCEALLYYNNSDLSSPIISDDMRKYCEHQGCLREFILQHFGFESTKEEIICCINCELPDEYSDSVDMDIFVNESTEPTQCRKIDTNIMILENELKIILDNWSNFIYEYDLDSNLSNKIANECIFINKIDDLLDNYGIWDDELADQIYECIEKNAPII